jgi:hypothetical protein
MLALGLCVRIPPANLFLLRVFSDLSFTNSNTTDPIEKEGVFSAPVHATCHDTTACLQLAVRPMLKGS